MQQAMSCPRCLSNLVEGRIGALTAHVCPRCVGVWLTTDMTWKVADGLDETTLTELREGAERARAAVDETPDELPCPCCDKAMRRQRLARAALDVDVCDAHGTWYDRGEIERIAAIVVPTGHDRHGTMSFGAFDREGEDAEQISETLRHLYELRKRTLAGAERQVATEKRQREIEEERRLRRKRPIVGGDGSD